MRFIPNTLNNEHCATYNIYGHTYDDAGILSYLRAYASDTSGGYLKYLEVKVEEVNMIINVNMLKYAENTALPNVC